MILFICHMVLYAIKHEEKHVSNHLQSPAAVAPGAKPPDQTWLGQLTHATFTG